MTNTDFFKSMSDTEWDEAEAIAELGHMLYRDLTEDAELLFVRTAMERKRANPSAKTDEILDAGLVAIGKPPLMSKRKLRSTLK